MFCLTRKYFIHEILLIKSLLDYLFDLESVRIKVARTVPVDPP